MKRIVTPWLALLLGLSAASHLGAQDQRSRTERMQAELESAESIAEWQQRQRQIEEESTRVGGSRSQATSRSSPKERGSTERKPTDWNLLAERSKALRIAWAARAAGQLTHEQTDDVVARLNTLTLQQLKSFNARFGHLERRSQTEERIASIQKRIERRRAELERRELGAPPTAVVEDTDELTRLRDDLPGTDCSIFGLDVEGDAKYCGTSETAEKEPEPEPVCKILDGFDERGAHLFFVDRVDNLVSRVYPGAPGSGDITLYVWGSRSASGQPVSFKKRMATYTSKAAALQNAWRYCEGKSVVPPK